MGAVGGRGRKPARLLSLLIVFGLWLASAAQAKLGQQQAASVAPQQSEKSQPSQQQASAKNVSSTPDLCAEPAASSQPAGQANSNKLARDQLADEFAPNQHSGAGFVEQKASDFVRPNFYTLRLKVDPNKRKFSGQLMIQLEVRAPATNSSGAQQSADSGRYLSLHAGANLHIRKAFYVLAARSGAQIRATKIGHNQQSELLTLDFYPNQIGPGQGLLLLVYSGAVNETDSLGLFLHRSQRASSNLASSKVAEVSQQSAGLATHMEPSFARRLFPSWDEPQLKARFSLIVVLPFRGYQTLSNMPIKRKSISLSCSGESLQEVEFQTTPPMSTYLLTLVVGHFDSIESITQNNCKVRAYFYSARPQVSLAAAAAAATTTTTNTTTTTSIEAAATTTTTSGAELDEAPNWRRGAARMALDLAVRTFDLLEGLLRIQYPLAKFDLIALRDFHAGAMENWGASIFHENYLLCDNSSQRVSIRVNGGATRPKRLVVPLVVAHEIAHQWFGNLITSRSWTYLWLNEGFAQLLMYQVADELLPGQDYWLVFMEDNRRSAMQEEELITSSRALEPSAEQLAELADQSSLFDQLTYNKGALLLRMVRDSLGKRQFFAGLQAYLLKHSYGSVDSHDLWQVLEESDRRREHQLDWLMANWLHQEGFPLLSVRIFEQPGRFLVELRQERFTLLPADRAAAAAAASQQGDANTAAAAANNSASQAQVLWANWTWAIPVTFAGQLRARPDEQEARLSPAAETLALPADQQQKRGLEAAAAASTQPAEQFSFVLTKQQANLQLDRLALGAWLKFNHNASGYFRVDYLRPSEEPSSAGASNWAERGQQVDMLERLVEPIRSQQLNVLDRFNLADDLFALVLAGRKSVDYYLHFVWRAYEREPEVLVLRTLFDSFERIKLALVSNEPELLQSWLSADLDSSTLVQRLDSSRTRLARQFDRFVRRFIRKVAEATNTSADHWTSWAQLSAQSSGGGGNNGAQSSAQLEPDDEAHVAASPQRRANESAAGGGQQRPSQLFGADSNGNWPPLLLAASPRKWPPARPQQSAASELLESSRAAYNDQQVAQAAQWLVSRHFRRANANSSSSSSSSLPLAPPAPLGQAQLGPMGRELRASIYALGLNAVERRVERRRRRRGSSTAGGLSPEERPTERQAAELHAQLLEQYNELLQQLASGGAQSGQAALESGAERAAIAWALGSSSDGSKQLQLLNLTLNSSLIRAQDSATLLEALGRSLGGRQLLWATIGAHSRQLEARQLLGVALKSVSKGLVEFSALSGGVSARPRATVEQQLRSLYQTHWNNGELAKLIGQAIEWLRINTDWHRRDRRKLERALDELPV